jgi:hypothetical protein
MPSVSQTTPHAVPSVPQYESRNVLANGCAPRAPDVVVVCPIHGHRPRADGSNSSGTPAYFVPANGVCTVASRISVYFHNLLTIFKQRRDNAEQ